MQLKLSDLITLSLPTRIAHVVAKHLKITLNVHVTVVVRPFKLYKFGIQME
jgi:hypothetical protein